MNVVQDWYDNGTIDRSYPRHCYTEALNNVGEDVRVYSSIEEDIKAAMQRSSRNLRLPASAGGDEPPPVAAPPSRKTGGGDQADLEPRAGLFKQSFDKLGPRKADSMPLPLLILGGLALLLIAAGAAGLISRRLRARKVQPS